MFLSDTSVSLEGLNSGIMSNQSSYKFVAVDMLSVISRPPCPTGGGNVCLGRKAESVSRKVAIIWTSVIQTNRFNRKIFEKLAFSFNGSSVVLVSTVSYYSAIEISRWCALCQNKLLYI